MFFYVNGKCRRLSFCVYCKFYFNLIFGEWILVFDDFYCKIYYIFVLGNGFKGLKLYFINKIFKSKGLKKSYFDKNVNI